MCIYEFVISVLGSDGSIQNKIVPFRGTVLFRTLPLNPALIVRPFMHIVLVVGGMITTLYDCPQLKLDLELVHFLHTFKEEITITGIANSRKVVIFFPSTNR